MQRRRLLATFGLAIAVPQYERVARLLRVCIFDLGLPHLFEAFFFGMRDLGYVEGQNVAYVRRPSAGQSESIPQLATELVNAKPDVIVTAGPTAVRAVMRGTSTSPRVFSASV